MVHERTQEKIVQTSYMRTEFTQCTRPTVAARRQRRASGLRNGRRRTGSGHSQLDIRDRSIAVMLILHERPMIAVYTSHGHIPVAKWGFKSLAEQHGAMAAEGCMHSTNADCLRSRFLGSCSSSWLET